MSQEIVEIKQDILDSYLAIAAPNLNAHQRGQFFSIAKEFGLNPFKREIYAVAYGNNLSIITGYEVYLKRAERTGKLDGMDTKIEGTGNDIKAICTIYRKDWSHPFVHEVYMREYAQQNSMWKSKPITMIKKVAIAQAFRLCFPDEFGGMPYTSDELPDNMTAYTEVKEQPSLPALPESELKGLRAKVNKSLTAKKTLLELQEFTNHFSEMTSLKTKVWDALTGHNDSETFQSLYNEHLKRVEQHEFRISPEGIDQWIEELNKCETAEKYKVFECAFNKNDYLQIPKVCDALAVKRSELGLEDNQEE